MRRTNIYLDQEQTTSLDRVARQEGLSRAELIRRLIDRGLTGADETSAVAMDLAAIEDSFGVLRDLEEPARRPGDREQHLAEMWCDDR